MKSFAKSVAAGLAIAAACFGSPALALPKLGYPLDATCTSNPDRPVLWVGNYGTYCCKEVIPPSPGRGVDCVLHVNVDGPDPGERDFTRISVSDHMVEAGFYSSLTQITAHDEGGAMFEWTLEENNASIAGAVAWVSYDKDDPVELFALSSTGQPVIRSITNIRGSSGELIGWVCVDELGQLDWMYTVYNGFVGH